MFEGQMTVKAIKASLKPRADMPKSSLQPIEVPSAMPSDYTDIQALNFWHICQHLSDTGELSKVSLIYVNAVVMAIEYVNTRDNAVQWIKVLHAGLNLLELKISHIRALGITIDDDLCER